MIGVIMVIVIMVIVLTRIKDRSGEWGKFESFDDVVAVVVAIRNQY